MKSRMVSHKAFLIFFIHLELRLLSCNAKQTRVNYKNQDGGSETTTEPAYKNPVYAGEKNMEEILDNPHFRFRKTDLGNDPNVWGDALSVYDTMLKFRENKQLDPNGNPIGIYQPGLFVPFMDVSDSFAARKEYQDNNPRDDETHRIGNQRLSGRKALIRQANPPAPATTPPTSLTTTTVPVSATPISDRAPLDCSAQGGAGVRSEFIGETDVNPNDTIPYSDQLLPQDRIMETQLIESEVYDGCGEKGTDGKVCFEWESGCIKNENCRMLATIQNTSIDRITVTLLLSDRLIPDYPYIGFGFSPDGFSGNDLMFYCIDTNNVYNSSKGNVSMYITYIDDDLKTCMQISKSVFAANVCPKYGYSTHGVLGCSFELAHDIVLDDGTEWRIMHEPFYQFLSFGYYDNSISPNDVKFGAIESSEVVVFSKTKEKLADTLLEPKVINARSSILVFLHVAFAVFSSIFLLPSGMIVAKFGREVYGHKVKAFCWKLPQWLYVHIRISVVCLILFLASLIVIIIELDATWQSKHSYEFWHSVIGCISMGLALLIFFCGCCLNFDKSCNSGEDSGCFKKFWTWLHWLVGNLVYATGVFCVATAGKMQRALAPCMVEYFGYLHVVIHVCVLLFMAIDTCLLVQKIDGRFMFQRAILGPMIPWNPGEVSKLPKNKEFGEAPCWKMRRRVIVFHFITSFLCAFAICMLMLLPTVLCRQYRSFM